MYNTATTRVKTRSQSQLVTTDSNMAESFEDESMQHANYEMENNSSLNISEDSNNAEETNKEFNFKAPATEINIVKGKVAGMVDTINNSPVSSPVVTNKMKGKSKKATNSAGISKDSRIRTLSSKGGILALNTMTSVDSMEMATNSQTENVQHDQPDELLSLMRTLNATVQKLEKKLDAMEAEKKQVDAKVSSIENIQSQEVIRVKGLIDKLDDHDDKIEALIGIVVRQDIEIQELKKKQNVAYVQTNMNNIMINGVPQTQNENVFHEATHFFKTKLKIEKKISMKSAKRIGGGESRPILVTLSDPNDKALIFQKTSNLKEINRGRQKPYFVTEQLPEAWAEKRRLVHYMKQQNKKLPTAQQLNIAVKKGQLHVAGKEYEPPVKTPTVSDVLNLPAERKRIIRHLTMLESETAEQDESIFVGYAAQVFSLQEIENYYLHLRMAEPEATHIMCAYRLPGTDFSQTQGFIDDGEHGGGRALMKMLQKMQVFNQAVFVTRHYGGKHLGRARFTLIEQCASEALQKLQEQIRKNRQPPTQEELDEYRRMQRQQPERRYQEDIAPWGVDNADEADQQDWGTDETDQEEI